MTAYGPSCTSGVEPSAYFGLLHVATDAAGGHQIAVGSAEASCLDCRFFHRALSPVYSSFWRAARASARSPMDNSVTWVPMPVA
jgi:hypothetical protein